MMARHGPRRMSQPCGLDYFSLGIVLQTVLLSVTYPDAAAGSWPTLPSLSCVHGAFFADAAGHLLSVEGEPAEAAVHSCCHDLCLWMSLFQKGKADSDSIRPLRGHGHHRKETMG